MANWLTGKCLALDTETSGVSVHKDRIVTATAAIVNPDGTVAFQRDWLIAVDIDIPAEATAVHGVTTEHAREHGLPTDVAVKEIANSIRYAVHSSMPVIAFNSVFDLSIINAECIRRGLGTLEEFCGRPIAPVVDPLCIDKHVDRYRPGSRKLDAVCAHYGVTLENAHTAAADAVAAVHVAQRLAERCRMSPEALRALYTDRRYPNEFARAFGSLGRMSAADLHAAQVVWYREQTDGLGSWWMKQAEELRHLIAKHTETGNDSKRTQAEQDLADLETRIDSLDGSWPLRMASTQGALS